MRGDRSLDSKPLRLAVWSGPRNISTAMMRAWENRPDTAVVDEPFYAHYLAVTGLDHPGREEVIAAGETDWRKVVAALTGPVPGGKRIHYQKHMTHHLLPGMARDWFPEVTHAFLIRDPREVLLSYVKSRPTVTVEDIGVPQQAEIYEEVRRATGEEPVVIDAGEFLKEPEAHLRAWCARLGIEFTERMLRWPPGPRPSDGVWAPYWYDAVIASTGFETYRERDRTVPPEHAPIVEATLPLYESLYARRLRP
jgi:sulfotransferase family protein